MSEGGLDLPPLGAITALRIVGRNQELPLLPTKRHFTLGSSPQPEVDLSVSSLAGATAATREHVSKLHVTLQRRANRLWVVDQTSTNGTFVGDRRETAFDLAAGQSFRVGDITLLALDEALRTLRPSLQWVLGLEAHAAVDEALQVVASGTPLLLLGPTGCGQRALAEAVHRTSARSGHPFVAIQPPLATLPEQLAVLAHASHGTAFLDLSLVDGPSARFVDELFGPTYRIRPIIAAPEIDLAGVRLGRERLPRLRVIGIPSLSHRAAEVPRLFDILFRRAGSKHSVADLGTASVAGLCARDWPNNLHDIELAAPRLLALLDHGKNVTAAAESLGMSRQALSKWIARLRVSLE